MSQWIPEINFPASDTPANSFDFELETAVRSTAVLRADRNRRGNCRRLGDFPHRCRGFWPRTPPPPAPSRAVSGPAGALALGSAGPAVLQVQRWLNVIASADQSADFVPETGQFDAVTEAALESYQLTAGLKTLGVVDADTWESLRLAAQELCRECQEG